MDWQYTNELDGPASTRLSALVQVSLPGGAARVSRGAATPLSAKFFETMMSTPAWISFWRCNPHAPWRCHPHAPPFPCSSGSAFRTCPERVSTLPRRQVFLSGLWHCFSKVLSDGVSHASRRCLARKRLCPLDCIDRGIRPWWKAHSGTAAYAQSGRVHVFIAILASDGGLKLLVELPHSALLLLPSLLAILSVTTAFHAHVAAVLPANISGLSR